MGAAQVEKNQPQQEYPEPINNQQVIQTLELAAQDLETIPADFVIPRETHLALREMESLHEKSKQIAGLLAKAGVNVSELKAPLSLLFLLLGWRQEVRCEKVGRLVTLMKELDEAFRDQEIEMAALVEHPKNEPVDLLLRFPGKHFFLLCIRSCGQAEIIFNEKRQKFFQKKPNERGLRIIRLDPVDTAMQQIVWLQKYYRPFFGGTSRAAKRPLCRLLVIWEPSRLGAHREQLYETFGDSKVLAVRYEQGGSVFAVNREDVIPFVKGHLAYRIDKEKNSD